MGWAREGGNGGTALVVSAKRMGGCRGIGKVAKALDGQRYPLPLSECMRV